MRHKVALMVGAGPRLGGAIARRFARDGYSVALLGRSPSTVEALAAALRDEGITAACAAADVVDADALSAAVARLADDAGGVEVAVHNVSVWREASVLDLAPADLLADVGAGTASLLTLVQALAPRMIGGGTILATGSAAADAPSPGAPTLGVQKAGLRALVQAMALELTPRGIHCATVTINGVLDSGPEFTPERIAARYAELAAETAGPHESWRTVVEHP